MNLLHKFQLLKLLSGIVDNPTLAANLHFKGGSCASLLGFLDRFSVDLDFDLKPRVDKAKLDKEFKKVFKKLDFDLQRDGGETLFYVLKYEAPEGQRSTIRLSITDQFFSANAYRTVFLPEIDRLVSCQTIETMFAHKLVAATDRYKRYKTIAGRDIYDIHHFFSKGYRFNPKIIEERTGLKAGEYLKRLADFIKKKVTEKAISEDLNALLPYEKFKKIRRILKPETLIFLRSF